MPPTTKNNNRKPLTSKKANMNVTNNPSKRKKVPLDILKKAASDASIKNVTAINIVLVPAKVFTNRHSKFKGCMKSLQTAISQSP